MRNRHSEITGLAIITICVVLVSLMPLPDEQSFKAHAQPPGDQSLESHGQPTGELSFETHDEAAKKAMESLTESSYFNRITEKEAKLLGYKSKDEIKIAKLGPPFQVRIVGLTQLRDFNSKADPETMLKNANFVLYPLIVGEEVRASLTVTQSPKSTSWKTTQWGSGSLLRELWKHRTSPSNFVVWIPSVNLYFVGDRGGGDLVLIPITDYPVHGFKAGMRLPVQRVFSALQKEAQADKGGPR